MTKIRDYSTLAKDILSEVGGQDNLESFSRCATRLRLILKTIPEQAVERIKQMPGVITVVISSGQFQVVIGTHVAEVYDAMSQSVDSDLLRSGPKKKRVLDAVISTMSAVFAPIIYVLAAAGILQGILIIVNLFSESFSHIGTFSVLNFMSWTPFAFLPVFIAITASKHFKSNIYIAVLCCCALINPEWGALAARISGGETISFLSLPLAKTVYTSSVLPPLFLVWGLSWFERRIGRILPDVVSPLFTPLICLVVMVPITLTFTGPIMAEAANGLAIGYNWLFNLFPPLAAGVIGGLWQVIVIFGVHWGGTPMVLANFDMYGKDSFQAFQTIAVVAQMAAAFACALKSRNQAFKTTAYSAGITGIFGITEPAIFGVTLRLKKPFICGCIGGAVGAVVASFFGSYYYAYAGLPSLLTVVNAINSANPMSFIGELLGVSVAIIVTFALVYIVGFQDPVDDRVTAPVADKKPQPVNAAPMPPISAVNITLLSPAKGLIVPLESVNDESFAQKLLGDGVAIIPSDGIIVAPCDATVATVIDSQHAVGLVCSNGCELLIHVGLDTVNLQGRHFKTLVNEGDTVKAGEPLIHFEKEEVELAGYDITTPFLVINSEDFTLTTLQPPGIIELGQPVINLSR